MTEATFEIDVGVIFERDVLVDTVCVPIVDSVLSKVKIRLGVLVESGATRNIVWK